MTKLTRKFFQIVDIDCEVIIEETTRKELLSYIDEYLENLEYDWFDGSDDSFEILYSDGSSDSINTDYDGHKVRKTNIEAICYNNPCTSIVFGNYSINEYGVVNASYNKEISENNIKEII